MGFNPVYRWWVILFLPACVMLSACSDEAPAPLNIGAMVQPLPDSGVFRLDDHHTWGPQVSKGQDGRYYLVYSRWPKNTFWWRASEIALAVSERAEGPYSHLSVLLAGRGPGHWDEAVAHNPKIKLFNGRYYLYYVSGLAKDDLSHYRVTQQIGVAVSDSITGPYQRLDEPILGPSPPLYNLAVNPGVSQMPDGRYLMIMKGEIRPVPAGVPKPQRIQGMAIASTPVGPFEMLPEPAIRNIDTEDASLWYDRRRNKYFAIFHAHSFVGLIESSDGFNWQEAEHYQIVAGNRLLRADGSMLQMTDRPLQRPNIFVEGGEPRLLTLAVPDPSGWHVVIVPLAEKK